MPDRKSHECSDKPRILLVDDDAALRGLLTVLLSQMSMEFQCAQNGKEAMEALHSSDKKRFQALVTDIRMPVMGGVELGRHVREEFPAMPILYISGFAPSMKEVEDELDEHSDFLMKPFSFPAFAEKLHTLLGMEPLSTPIRAGRPESADPSSAGGPDRDSAG